MRLGKGLTFFLLLLMMLLLMVVMVMWITVVAMVMVGGTWGVVSGNDHVVIITSPGIQYLGCIEGA